MKLHKQARIWPETKVEDNIPRKLWNRRWCTSFVASDTEEYRPRHRGGDSNLPKLIGHIKCFWESRLKPHCGDAVLQLYVNHIVIYDHCLWTRWVNIPGSWHWWGSRRRPLTRATNWILGKRGRTIKVKLCPTRQIPPEIKKSPEVVYSAVTLFCVGVVKKRKFRVVLLHKF